jgi:hypothetical protein
MSYLFTKNLFQREKFVLLKKKKFKFKKPKKTFLVVFLGGFFGWFFYCQPCNKAHTSEISLVGRLVFNTWRMMRGELALYSYTLESVAFKVAFMGEGS